jgi:hypothetical protein
MRRGTRGLTCSRHKGVRPAHPKQKLDSQLTGQQEAVPQMGGGTEGAEPGEGGQNSQDEGPNGPNKEGRSSGDQEVDLEGLYSVEKREK